MKAEQGRYYSNGKQPGEKGYAVRRLDCVVRYDYFYTVIEGRNLGKTLTCFVTTFEDWAKEDVTDRYVVSNME